MTMYSRLTTIEWERLCLQLLHILFFSFFFTIIIMHNKLNKWLKIHHKEPHQHKSWPHCWWIHRPYPNLHPPHLHPPHLHQLTTFQWGSLSVPYQQSEVMWLHTRGYQPLLLPPNVISRASLLSAMPHPCDLLMDDDIIRIAFDLPPLCHHCGARHWAHMTSASGLAIHQHPFTAGALWSGPWWQKVSWWDYHGCSGEMGATLCWHHI